MREVIFKLHEILNMIKGFTAGYSSDAVGKGKMLFDYQGKRYVLSLVEIECPSENICDDIRILKYYP